MDSQPSQPTSQTVSQLSYAPEIQPIINKIFSGAATLAQQPYQPYQYNRIAGFDPIQLQAQQAAANMRVSPYLGFASEIAGNVANRAGQLGRYSPTRFQEERVTPESVSAGRATTGRFTDPGVMQSYMSPYMQGVVDIGKREAQRQADIASTQRGAQAIGSGAFGGSRQAIMEAEAQRNLAQQMGDIQTRGSQAAFEQAAQQFQTDEARNLAMQQTNIQARLQAALANQQTGLAAALANQAKNLEVQQLREQSRQFGADLGLRGLQQQLLAGQQFAGLGQQQFGQAKDILGMQATAGAERQAMQQRKLTQDYQDFLAQKQDPYTKYAWLMEMARGMPMTQTQQIYQAPPSVVAQAGGAGLAYLGARRAFPEAFAAEGGSVPNGLARVAADKLMQG